MNNNLIEAISNFLKGDPALLNAYPSGFENGEADRDLAMPYGVFTKANSKPLLIIGGQSIDNVTIHFHSFATSAQQAEWLGTALKARLLPSKGYTPTAFTFVDGSEVGRYLIEGETTGIDPERGPLNVDVWRNSIPIVWQVARG